jgi:hypothetical protein
MIPERQDLIDTLTKKYLTDPEQESSNGNGHYTGSHTSALSDEEITAKCREAKNAEKFTSLFDDGDTSAHGHDDSRADMALASLLAFYTDDHAQLERIMSASALGRRAKWRKRPDYRQRTIDHAIQGRRETYTLPQPSKASSEGHSEDAGRRANPLLAGRVDLGKAISQGIDPPDELEPDLLLVGKIHHLFGPSESGKTIISLWLVKRRIQARQYVIVFDSENGPRTIAERLKQMGVDLALISEYLIYLPFPDLTVGERSRQAFYDLLDEIKPTLIVFDSWASFLSSAGYSENENAEIEHWDNAITKKAKERGIASVILDHTPHDTDRSRGGARKKEVADVQWQVKKTQKFDRDSVGEVLLIQHKDREGWLPPTVKFSVGGRYGELVCERSAGTIEEPGASDGLTRSERTVLDTLRDEFALTGARMSEWQRATDTRDVSRATHFRAVKKLVSAEVSPAHRVRRVDETYFPPDDTSPTKDRETTGSGIYKAYTPRSYEVSNRSHETDETSADQGGLTGLSPLKGETMRPTADTDGEATAGKEWPTRERERRIRSLMDEGYSEYAARVEVLARDHPVGCECEVCA